MLGVLARLWIGGLAGAFACLMLAGARLAEAPALAGPLQRAVGFAGWGLVAAGFLGVALATFLKNRPRPRRPLVRAQVAGQEPEEMIHSEVYTPPPYRRAYRSNRRRR